MTIWIEMLDAKNLFEYMCNMPYMRTFVHTNFKSLFSSCGGGRVKCHWPEDDVSHLIALECYFLNKFSFSVTQIARYSGHKITTCRKRCVHVKVFTTFYECQLHHSNTILQIKIIIFHDLQLCFFKTHWTTWMASGGPEKPSWYAKMLTLQV